MKKIFLLTKQFTEQIDRILVPFLFEQGFSQQSIDHYRRIDQPFIHCIWLQERSDRKAVCMNMGVHLDFLPVAGRSTTTPVRDVVEIECSIRTRLSSKGRMVEWWPAIPAEQQVRSIKALFEEKGVKFFQLYDSFPSVFESITVEDVDTGAALRVLPEMTRRAMALFLARVYEHIGNKGKAVGFAEYGLELVNQMKPMHAKPMKKTFEDIIKRCKTP